MIIVTQDKTGIINWSSIESVHPEIVITLPGQKPSINKWKLIAIPHRVDRSYGSEYPDAYSLGAYISRERCAEVIQEITNEYGKFYRVEGGPTLITKDYIQPLMFEPPKVYRMPEE